MLCVVNGSVLLRLALSISQKKKKINKSGNNAIVHDIALVLKRLIFLVLKILCKYKPISRKALIS